MGFIEEMAKAKAYDKMQSRQVEDTMAAASKALGEQKAKEANMNKVFQDVIRSSEGGLANIIGSGVDPRELAADLGRTIGTSTAEEGYNQRLNNLHNAEYGYDDVATGAGWGGPGPIDRALIQNERANVEAALQKVSQAPGGLAALMAQMQGK